MKLSRLHLILSFQILFAGTQVHAQTPQPSSCQMDCTQYTALQQSIANGGCRPYEALLRENPDAQVPSHCRPGFAKQWSNFGLLCNSHELKLDAKDKQRSVVTAFTAVAAVCLSACAPTALRPFLEPVCKFGGLSAAGLDIFNTFGLVAKGQQFSDFWGGMLGVTGSVAGAGAGGILLTDVVARDSCWAGGVFAAAAAAKYASCATFQSSANQDCKDLRELASTLPGFEPGDGPRGQANPTSRAGSPSLPGSGNYGQITQSAPMNSHLPGTGVAPPVFTGAQFAATAGPASSLLDQMLDRDSIPKNFEKATGMTLDELGKRLETESPANFLSGLSGMNPAFAERLKGMDSDIQSGALAYGNPMDPSQALALTGSANGAYSGGGGGGAKNGTGAKPFEFSFGKGKDMGPGAGKVNEVSFEPKSREISSVSDDIWHAGYNGTIFDIVTDRLEQSRHRIQEGDWTLPLNRALMGLPVKADQGKGK